MSPKTPRKPAFLFAFLTAIMLMAPLGFLYVVVDQGDGGGDANLLVAQAQNYDYAPLAPLPDPTISIQGTGLAAYLQKLFWFAIVGAGILAVLMITLGGLRYTASEAFGEKQAAKNQITMAIAGFLLAISSVLILQTINPDLLKFKLMLARPTILDELVSTATAPSGCNAVSGIARLTKCEWVATYAYASCEAMDLNQVNLSRSDCSEPKPDGITSNYKCCGYAEPKNGCTGQGVSEGFKECAWSVQGTVGSSDCTDEREMDPRFILDVDEKYCTAAAPGNVLEGYDCCARIF